MNIKKKGFTIVELVIVIAVVAILAAVLIPTFASLINKANMSSDQRAVRDMNIALALDELDKEFSSIADVRTTLKNAGYSSENFVPLQANTKLYWIPKLNRIILADENHNVLYPTNLEGIPVYDENATGDDMWVPLFQENALIIDDAPPVSVVDYYDNKVNIPSSEVVDPLWGNLIDITKCQKLVKFDIMENGSNDINYQIEYYGSWLADYVITLDDDFKVDTCGIIGGFEDDSTIWNTLILTGDGVDNYPGFVKNEEDSTKSYYKAGTEFYLIPILAAAAGWGSMDGITYEGIIQMFGPDGMFESFICGAFNYEKENIGKSVTVQLRLFEQNEDGTKGEKFVVLNEITCEFTENFIMPREINNN